MIFELHRSRQLGYTGLLGREERAAYQVKFRILRAHIGHIDARARDARAASASTLVAPLLPVDCCTCLDDCQRSRCWQRGVRCKSLFSACKRAVDLNRRRAGVQKTVWRSTRFNVPARSHQVVLLVDESIYGFSTTLRRLPAGRALAGQPQFGGPALTELIASTQG